MAAAMASSWRISAQRPNDLFRGELFVADFIHQHDVGFGHPGPTPFQAPLPVGGDEYVARTVDGDSVRIDGDRGWIPGLGHGSKLTAALPTC